MTHDDEEDRGPGGMDAIEDEPVTDSEEPGGMSAIPDPDPETGSKRTEGAVRPARDPDRVRPDAGRPQ